MKLLFRIGIALLLLSVVFLAWSVPGFGGDSTAIGQRTRDLAVEAFARSDFEAAIGHYRSLVDEGTVDAALFYNLGTAYAETGDVGRATWMLLLARRLAPRDRDIRANLGILASRYGRDLDSQVAIFPLAPVQAVFDRLTLNEWAFLAGAATLLLAGLVALVYSRPRGSRSRVLCRRAAIALGVAALIGHHFAAFRYYEEAYSPRGVIVEAETYPHAAPSEEASVYEFTLPPGSVVRVRSAGVKGWVKAIYGGKNEVFIRRSQMEYLRP